VILGAGPTGLSAAHHYGAGSVLLEREARVGGSCRSIEDTGFTFDHAGHIMFSNDPYVQELYRLLLGDNVHWQERDAWVHTHGGYRVWSVPLSESDTSWLGERVTLPNEASDAGARSIGPSARFGYPLRGGFQALMNGFLPLLRGDLLLRANVARVAPREHAVTLEDGRRFRYDVLISTLPLPLLVAAIGEEAPADVRRAAGDLRHVSVRCVNLGVARPHVTDKHWIHFPEGTVFQRVFMQGNASPHCNPPGGFGITCEITYSPSKPLPATGAALVERCFRECVDVGLLEASDGLLTTNQVDIPYAYVVYDQARAESVARIRRWLAQYDILPAGRFGEWEHYNSDHAFIAGRNAAEAARRLAGSDVAAKSA
jgi:protoporphyrinogen oxidase